MHAIDGVYEGQNQRESREKSADCPTKLSDTRIMPHYSPHAPKRDFWLGVWGKSPVPLWI
jgi:hypothetical protein